MLIIFGNMNHQPCVVQNNRINILQSQDPQPVVIHYVCYYLVLSSIKWGNPYLKIIHRHMTDQFHATTLYIGHIQNG